jgi:hypothetical protein
MDFHFSILVSMVVIKLWTSWILNLYANHYIAPTAATDTKKRNERKNICQHNIQWSEVELTHKNIVCVKYPETMDNAHYNCSNYHKPLENHHFITSA